MPVTDNRDYGTMVGDPLPDLLHGEHALCARGVMRVLEVAGLVDRGANPTQWHDIHRDIYEEIERHER